MHILKYKGYEGSAEIDMDLRVCRGKILFVTDLITYQAPSPSELQNEFEAAVDDYLDTCKALNRSPEKPLKGSFNVRVKPELHKAAFIRAVRENSSMNDIVVQALTAYLETDKAVMHNHTHRHTHQVVVSSSGDRRTLPETLIVSTGSPNHWVAHGIH
nr:type II toxin-antitoxin system HicB family antitoxin [uncultured Duganella sp.]